jgi:hypothetical protein
LNGAAVADADAEGTGRVEGSGPMTRVGRERSSPTSRATAPPKRRRSRRTVFEGVVGGGAAFAGVCRDERGSLMGPESASSDGSPGASEEDAGGTGLESGMGKRPVRMVKGA